MTTKDRYERLYEAGILNEYGSLFKLGMWEFIESELLNERKRVLEEVLEAIDERIIKLSEFKGRIHTIKEAHAVYELLEIKASITKQLEKSP